MLDAIKVYPRGSLRGRAAIEKFYADVLADKSYDGAPSTLGDVKAVDDDVILIAGQWSGTWTGPKGPVPMSGRWTMTYVREGGSWKIAMETANVAPGE